MLDPEITNIALESRTRNGKSIAHASIVQPIEGVRSAFLAEKTIRTGLNNIKEIELDEELNRRLTEGRETDSRRDPFVGAFSSKQGRKWKYDGRKPSKQDIFIMPHGFGVWFLKALANHPGDTGTRWANVKDQRMQLEGIPLSELPCL